ncbi:MAG: proline dehydrogenase, partial [Bacteroidota bacterium]
MKNEGKPVLKTDTLNRIAKAFARTDATAPSVDFSNTEIAFADKSDKELRKMATLFRLMNNPFLVKIGAALAMIAVKIRLPFFETIVRKTIFPQFCGGTTLLDSQASI